MSNFSDDALDAIADDPWTTWAATAPRELAAELRAYRRQHGPLAPGQCGTPVDRLAEVEAERDAAYRGRAELLAVLAAIFPARMAFTDPAAPGWPVLFLTTPAGQATWHINPDDFALFDPAISVFDPADCPVWDGHSNEQKSERLRALALMIRGTISIEAWLQTSTPAPPAPDGYTVLYRDTPGGDGLTTASGAIVHPDRAAADQVLQRHRDVSGHPRVEYVLGEVRVVRDV